MKNSLLKTTLLFCVAFIVLTGNAIAKTDITDQFTIKRISHNKHQYIKSVKVIQDDDSTIISGKLKLHRKSHGRFKGHVDIWISSPDSKSINSTSVYYRKRHRHQRRIAKFKARLSEILQEGSTIRVALHKSDDLKKTKEGLNCGNNLAQLK